MSKEETKDQYRDDENDGGKKPAANGKRSKAIQKKDDKPPPDYIQIRRLLSSPGVQRVISEAIPKGVNLDAKRLAWTASTLIETPNEKGENPLLACEPASIARTVIQAAELGLEFGSHLGHCYMIPRGGRACFQMGFRGYIILAYRGGKIKRVWSDVIYQADEFKIVRGEFPQLSHDTTLSEFLPGRDVQIGSDKPLVEIEKGGAGMPLGAYACAELQDGRVLWDVISEDNCARARAGSKALNSPAYKTWPDEMRRRTAITRARKAWPIDPLMATAQQIDDTGDGGSTRLTAQIEAAVIEATGESSPNASPKPKALDALVAEHGGDGES